MSERPFVDCQACGNPLASMRMDRAELAAALDGDLREVCLLCTSVRLYARTDYYYPVESD